MSDSRTLMPGRDLNVVSIALRRCRRLVPGACCIGFDAVASDLVTLALSFRQDGQLTLAIDADAGVEAHPAAARPLISRPSGGTPARPRPLLRAMSARSAE